MDAPGITPIGASTIGFPGGGRLPIFPSAAFLVASWIITLRITASSLSLIFLRFPAVRTGSPPAGWSRFLFRSSLFWFILFLLLATNPSQPNIKYIVLRQCKLLQPLCINRIYTYLSDRQKYDIFRTHSSRIRENWAFLLFACTG